MAGGGSRRRHWTDPGCAPARSDRGPLRSRSIPPTALSGFRRRNPGPKFAAKGTVHSASSRAIACFVQLSWWRIHALNCGYATRLSAYDDGFDGGAGRGGLGPGAVSGGTMDRRRNRPARQRFGCVFLFRRPGGTRPGAQELRRLPRSRWQAGLPARRLDGSVSRRDLARVAGYLLRQRGARNPVYGIGGRSRSRVPERRRGEPGAVPDDLHAGGQRQPEDQVRDRQPGQGLYDLYRGGSPPRLSLGKHATPKYKKTNRILYNIVALMNT